MPGAGQFTRALLGIRLGRLHQYPPRAPSVRSVEGPRAAAGSLPGIALVTPSYNQAQYVGRTIDSVSAQDYPALEYVVQDGGSTDGTRELLAACPAGVRVCIEADAGQADAINRGLARTGAPLMGWLNSDDMLLPGTLHRVAHCFSENPRVDVVYGNRLVVDADGAEVGRWVLPGHDGEVLRFVDYVPQETLFWRRSLWDRVGGRLDASLHFALDWDLLLRFIEAGAVFRHLPELFGLFRAHGGQKTQADYSARGAGEMAALRRRQGSRLPGLARRSALHASFLLRHRAADARFAASLRRGRLPAAHETLGKQP